MTTSSLDPQGPGRPPWTPMRSGWPQWIGHVAAAWSLGYGLLGLYWSLGGAGFPFGTENDPYAAKVSVLEHLQQDTAAPAVAVLGWGAAVVAMAMAHGRAQGLPGAALLGFAWTMAVVLAVVVPDVRPLTSLARTPIVLIGMPFGWPPGIGLSTLFPWPVINQLLLILGGLLWAATAIAYQRRIRNACGHCGRTDAHYWLDHSRQRRPVGPMGDLHRGHRAHPLCPDPLGLGRGHPPWGHPRIPR